MNMSFVIQPRFEQDTVGEVVQVKQLWMDLPSELWICILYIHFAKDRSHDSALELVKWQVPSWKALPVSFHPWSLFVLR